MTAHELARKLLEGPDLMVTLPGYEGGVNEITDVSKPEKLRLESHDAWYYGKHEYLTDYEKENELPNNKIIDAINIW